MSKCAISQIVQTSQHFVIRMYLEYLLEAAQTSLKFGVAAQNNSKMLLFRPPASVISIPLNTGTCGCISLITFGISGCKQIAPSKGSHLYPSDNAKRQFDVMGGWVSIGVFWRYAVVIYILLGDIEREKSKTITQRSAYHSSFTFFNNSSKISPCSDMPPKS